jgi:Tol biopolymer transport system component
VDCRSTGKFTEIATEGFTHPEHVIWAPDSKWIAYTKRLTNEYSSIFIYSLDQKKSFQITDAWQIVKYLPGIRVVNIFILQQVQITE